MDKYYETFFKNLEELHKNNPEDDPMVKLTTANIEACKFAPCDYNGGHSNIFKSSKLKVKTKKQLLSYRGLRSRFFIS